MEKQPKSPGRKSFSRIAFIHKLVKNKRYPNVPQLAQTMEVSPRTIERDIEALKYYFQAPIYYDSYKKGFYYTDSFDLPHVKLTEGEAVALVLSHQLFSQYKGTPFGKTLKSAIEKLYGLLPETVSIDMDELCRFVSFDIRPPRGEEDKLARVYEGITEAIRTRRTVIVNYYTAYRDVVTDRSIDPYHLRYHQGAWYVIAFCHLRNSFRVFALDRILSYQLTEQDFQVREEFSLNAFLGHSFGIEVGSDPVEVAVRFDSYQARFMQEQVFHPSQQIEELKDGSLIIRMTVSGLGEVKRWVLGFGSHAEVLAPLRLRQEVEKELLASYGKYKG